MARRRSSRRRTPREWGIRLALAAAVSVAGYFAVTHAIAEAALRKDEVARAYRLAPQDPQIMAAMARDLLKPGVSPAERAEADRMAHTALRLDPTAVAAVTTLGLEAGLRGDDAKAKRLFAYSQTLSRRDFRTQIWAVEDAVNRGDIPAALHAYDIALRTSRNAPLLMFPVLASAISDSSIRSELVRTLAANPSWRHAFIEFAAENGPDPRATAVLFLALTRANIAVSAQANATLTNALVAKKQFDDAWNFYAGTHPGADRHSSRDAHFATTTETPGPFDWTPLGAQGIATSFQRGEHGGIFDFSAPPSIGGPLLQQMQLLPPGAYILKGHSIGIDQPPSALPYWGLICADGRELGRVTIPNSDQANGIFTGALTIPADCPVQFLTLVGRPSEAISGLSGQIDKIELHRIR